MVQYVALHRPQLQMRLTNIQLYGISGTNSTCQHKSMETVHLMHRMPVGNTAAAFDSRFQAYQQTQSKVSLSQPDHSLMSFVRVSYWYHMLLYTGA
jgi:hypothetical protein